MDCLNLLHVLAKSVQDIGHGVMLANQDDIESKTLVCFLDKRGVFRYGYGYKCGSYLRVVCWEEDAKKLRTVPVRSFLIAFTGIRTWKQLDAENFQSADFLFKDWFDDEKKQAVKQELQGLINKEEMISDAVDLLAQMNIEEIAKAINVIKELRPKT